MSNYTFDVQTKMVFSKLSILNQIPQKGRLYERGTGCGGVEVEKAKISANVTAQEAKDKAAKDNASQIAEKLAWVQAINKLEKMLSINTDQNDASI